MKNKYIILLATIVILTNASCLNRQFIEGRAELISTSDTLLNDSSLFAGKISYVDMIYFYSPVEVWIENTNYKTTSDSAGYYVLKTLPGTYTIRCQSKLNTWTQLIEEKKDIKIGKNQKVQIDFYLGYTIE